MKIRFVRGRPPQDLGCGNEGKKPRKTIGQVVYMLVHQHGNNSEIRWGLVNLVGYRVLTTYYYMSFFHLAWIEVWLYIPNKFIKLTNAFYLLKHKTKTKHLWLTCAQCTCHTCVNVDIYVTLKSLCVFRKKRTRHWWRQVAQAIHPLRMPLLQFPQKSTSRTASKVLRWSSHRFLQPGIQISPALSYHTNTGWQMILDYYPNFLRVPQRCWCLQPTGSSLENTMAPFPRGGVDVSHHLGGLITGCYW